MEPLFLTSPQIEKTAMEARLSDSADTWPQEILQEALRQHPYLGQYDVSPVMREVDGERGYALGMLMVRNKTSRLNTEAGRTMAAAAGVRSVRIPLIVKDKHLKSIDVFFDHRGKPKPLNEERVRQSLFRPDLFDSTGTPPRFTQFIGNQLIPPARTERMISGRGTVYEEGEIMKSSSERPRFLIEAIAPTMLKSDIDRVEDELNKDHITASTLLSKTASRHLMEVIASVKPISVQDVANTTSDIVKAGADTVQVSRRGSEYILKTASSRMFAPQQLVLDRIKMASVVGEDVVSAVDKSGVATLSTQPVVKSDITTDDKVGDINQFGEYKVIDASGKEHMGCVFPSVLHFDGTSLPLKVFTNGTAGAIQSDIVGSLVGKSSNIVNSDHLDGNGFFYVPTDDGSAIAFIPGTITSTQEDTDGPAINFLTIANETVRLRLTPGIAKPINLGGGEYAIPSRVRWSPLRGEALNLSGNASDFSKKASVLKIRDATSIRSDGQTWSFSGPALGKIASNLKTFLEADDAMFMACALGMEPKYAMKKLAQAGQRGSVTVFGCRTLVPPSERIKEARDLAKKAAAQLPPKYLLLKEAADLYDIDAVDKVLSLGFLTPENVSTFIDYLPDFEDSIEKVAHLLVACRLGLPDVSEMSAKMAMERMEEVTQGLKKLTFRQAA